MHQGQLPLLYWFIIIINNNNNNIPIWIGITYLDILLAIIVVVVLVVVVTVLVGGLSTNNELRVCVRILS